MAIKKNLANALTNSMDDLFGGADLPEEKEELDKVAERVAKKTKGDITQIEIEKLETYHNHTFQVRDDAEMDELVASIKDIGIIIPLVVRQKKNKYEIIAGHRRRRAAELAGLKKVPCIIVDVGDDEADIMMVDSNSQREIRPSEKAFSYRLKLDAMKRQGKRVDLKESDAAGEKSIAKLASESGDSSTQIQRYIRLTFLDGDLLDMVDGKSLALSVGVILSYLSTEEQAIIYDIISQANKGLTIKQAEDLRKAAKGGLTQEKAEAIILGKLKPREKKPPKPKFDEKHFSKLVPEEIKKMEIEKRLRFHERAIEVFLEYLETHPDELNSL